MRSFYIWLFIFGALSGAVAAETVGIRSADHKDFTRVALDLANPGDVKIAQENKIIRVIFPYQIDPEGVEQFFDRITKERISAFKLDTTRKQLELSLACNCSYQSFIAGTKTFVIDVVQTSADEPEPEQLALSSNWTQFSRVQQASLGFDPVEEQVELVEKPTEAVVTTGENLSTLRLLDALDTVRENVQEEEQLQQISIDAKVEDSQITFRSLPVSQSRASVQIELNAHESFHNCDGAEVLNPANWPKYEDANQFLIASRQKVSNASDDFADADVREMAMAYLSLAMGAEARSILNALKEPSKTDDHLIELASFMDDDLGHTSEGWLAEFTDCVDVLLWKMLKQASKEDQETAFNAMKPDELRQARKQFEEWPNALKGVFAPLLARAFFERGEADAALYTLRKTEGKPERRSGERELVQANISEESGDPQGAIEILRPIASADVDTAPDAIISLAKLVAAQGEKLKDSETAALETYQEELKGTDLEPDLLRARIIAAVRSEQFDSAIVLIDDFAKLVRASKTNLVVDELGVAILQVKSDSKFLREAVSLPATYFNMIAEETQNQIKARIVDLGFEELAAQLGQYAARTREAGMQKPRESQEVSGVDGQVEVEPIQDGDPTLGTDSSALGDIVAAAEQADNAPIRTPQSIRNASPLAEAIDETKQVLDSMDDLKNEMSLLGLAQEN